MADKPGIPTVMDQWPYRYAPPDLSPAIPLSTQRMTANCFIASIGTPFSAVSAADLGEMTKYLQHEKTKGNDGPAIGIWNAAVDQAYAVLDGDSLNQRMDRSMVFARDLLFELTPRQGLTRLLKSSDSAEPPLQVTSAPSQPKPGRCR